MSFVPFFEVFLVVSLAYATLWGGPPERLAALLYALGSVGSLVGGWGGMPSGFELVPTYLLAVDFLLLIGLAALTTRANRLWLIPATACQLDAVLAHVTKLLAPAMIPTSYAFLVTIWSWPMVGLLTLGTWNYRRRGAFGNGLPSWKPILIK